ncbi:hypothetical protein M6B38_297080 [Iris pallida]|uniref:Uncharacterized protein n=1 Tax=Iris pallida TaxID=29817 RepID=A0AAX6HSQ1_IRIPA|nr:hypothetical protein M6B38_297080 [Iris pallida]
MAYNTKALLLLVGFLLAIALLGSSEVLTHKQLAQNHVEKTMDYGNIPYPGIPGYGYIPYPGIGPVRSRPRPRPRPCRNHLYCRPPADNEIKSGKPHH